MGDSLRMSKVRVYELARELKMESKALVSRLNELGVEVASHQSTLTADQILKVKKELSGGASASSAPKVIRRRAARPAKQEEVEQVADKPESVVRRRKVAAKSEAENESAEQKASEEKQVASEDKPKLAEKPSTPSESVAEAVTSEASASVDTAASAAEEESAEVVKDAVQESSETVTISAKSEADVSQPVKADKVEESAPEKPRSSGGATIVRRASPEEVEARRKALEKSRSQAARPRRDRDSRPDADSRRERPRQDTYSADSSSPSMPFVSESPESDSGKWKDKSKKSAVGAKSEVEEEKARRVAPTKAKRDQLNVRTLLNQLDDGDADAVTTPVPGRRKTVYTPQAGRSRRDMKRRKDLKKTQITTPKASLRVVKMGHDITVGDLAKQLAVKSAEIIKKLMAQGMMVTINQEIDFDTVSIIAADYNYEVKSNVVSLEDILSSKKQVYSEAEKHERPPIVTIMGHVDHGKTSILDAVRKAKVVDGEAGGITQHIGAYKVDKDGRQIAFLDTPGHEAFSAMRARGAQVTDIVVLVVAADDGVMPQTVEAISHAKAAGVPIIVAVNKMDKPNINLERVFGELMEHGIQSEEWGGDTQFVKVSALQGTGLDDLLDAILLQSEILELSAAVKAPATGSVVEAHLDKGRGPVATVMVQEGELKVGDYVVAGHKFGRVRAMHDHRGIRLDVAGPSTPVEILGLSDVPMAGDVVDVVSDEKTAREVSEWRVENENRAAGSKSSAASLDELLNKVKAAETPELPVIVKADTQGSLEAISEAVLKLNSDRVRNRIVHKAVGGINESDVTLAETSNAVVVAFNVRAARGLDDLAEQKGVLVKYFSVIYDIVDALKAVMAGKLPPVQKEVVQGHAEVRQTIRVPKLGTVAGTAVLDGKVTRASNVRLIRDDVVIFSGKVGSLRRFKDDVREVAQGYECGIGIEGYNDIREGDVIETFVIEEHAPAL